MWEKVKTSRRYWALCPENRDKDIKKSRQANNEGERGGGMADYAVVEQGETLSRRLAAQFGQPGDLREGVGLLIIGPGMGRLAEPLRCGTVLLPGACGGLLEQIRAKSAVSYGLSPKDTITLSSRRGDRLWVAVQRELVRMDGTVLERQELSVELEEGMDTLHALALTGAGLILGCFSEERGSV